MTKFYLYKIVAAALFAVGLAVPALAQTCGTTAYAAAFRKMHTMEHQDALQDVMLRFLEKGTLADLNGQNLSSPLGYLLRAERNQYSSNNYRGMAARYDLTDPQDMAEIQDAFLDYENDPCSLTEFNVDRVAKHLSRTARHVLELLLLGYSKTEIDEELGFYRGKTGRILRDEVIPVAESVFGY